MNGYNYHKSFRLETNYDKISISKDDLKYFLMTDKRKCRSNRSNYKSQINNSACIIDYEKSKS
jgi:hypothetical protein